MNMPTPRLDISGDGTLVNGKIYVMGGSDQFGSNEGTNANEAYNPATDTWEIKAPMPRNRIAHMSAAVGNKIYVFGGTDGSGTFFTRFINEIDVYDVSTNSWSTLPIKMPTPVSDAAIAQHNGKIYILGGTTQSGVTSKVYEFDPSDTSWHAHASLSSPRTALAATVSGAKIYVIGGEDGQDYLDLVEFFIP